MKEKKFYVYILLDPRIPGEFKYGEIILDYKPFYVGKGSGSRCSNHFYKHLYSGLKYHKDRVINKIINENLLPIIYKVEGDLTEKESFGKEIELIKLIGRKKNGGPLTNGTDGGEGTSGHKSWCKGKTLEEIYGDEKAKELKEKLSSLYRGKTLEELHGSNRAKEIKEKIGKASTENNKNRKITEEHKKNISLSLLGNTRRIGCRHSEETKNKITKSKKGTESWNAMPVLQINKNGELIKEWRSSSQAANELKLSQGNIWSVINGNRKTCGGFIWKLKK